MERLKRALRQLTPAPPTIGLEICITLSADDLAAWRTTHPDGEVVELLPDGGGVVVDLRLMT